MCVVCGCDGKGQTVDGHSHHAHEEDHHHHHHHSEDGALDYGAGAAGVHVPGQSQTRLIEIEHDILSKNDALAAQNRHLFADQGIVAINLMSSPGSGKTTLLVETLKALTGRPVGVIEGDQQTSNDAARIRETGTAAIQVNTGKGCHLDAEMVGHAMAHLKPEPGTLLFIENVGNLVCPAAFDLGETRRVVLASVTEGEDKPLKYPEMFAAADAMIVTKTDLLPHLNFDVDLLIENARKVQPRLDVLKTSATGAPGIKSWLSWLNGLSLQFQEAAE